MGAGLLVGMPAARGGKGGMVVKGGVLVVFPGCLGMGIISKPRDEGRHSCDGERSRA